MKSPKYKQAKQKISRSGNSEFTRAKLDQQYNPKARFFKPSLMRLNELSQQDRHQYIARQQSQICDLALSEVKKGVKITLDWSTKSNFRTTRSQFPKVKSQPIQFFRQRLNKSSQNGLGKTIQSKRNELSNLLFRRVKKLYMLSNRERQYQEKLFGESHSIYRNSKTVQHSMNNSKNYNTKPSTKKTQSLQEVQEKILNTSKLKILKEELKNKLFEIRQSFNKKKSNLKHPLAKFLDK